MVLKLNGTVSLCIAPNYESRTLIIHVCELAVSDLHFATVYGLRTDLGSQVGSQVASGGCKIPGEDAPRPPYKLLHFTRKLVQT